MKIDLKKTFATKINRIMKDGKYKLCGRSKLKKMDNFPYRQGKISTNMKPEEEIPESINRRNFFNRVQYIYRIYSLPEKNL